MRNKTSVAPLIAVSFGALLVMAGCSREDSNAKRALTLNSNSATSQPGRQTEAQLTATLPKIGGVAGYTGSQDCRPCHEEQFASWHRSYHRTMTQIAGPESVQANFHDVILTNETTRFVLNQKSNEFWVRMERLAAPGAVDVSASLETRIGLVTGSHHMQVFWVGDETHQCQIGFPFTWLIPEKRWVPRNSTFIRPPSIEHRAETWNHVCARCHATGSQPNLDRASLTWKTQVSELGISCEACHGPAERHVLRQRELKALGQKSATNASDLAIVHPEKLPPVRAAQICGFCHSMKWWDQSEGWPQRGFRFRPGDDLEATTPVIRPTQAQKQPWLRRALENNPDLFRDFFWPDGMIRVSGREYNGLIESPCYRGGQISCLSCHSLHKSEPDDQLARNRTDNRACTQCHQRLREEGELVRHSHHLPQSSGSECYNCHMPFTTYGVLKAIRSHQISSPKVHDQLATGRPNACNLCHLDKPLAWTTDQLKQWYSHPAPQLVRTQVEVAEAVRLALAGDAGQRALMAWHLGWKTGRETTNERWIAPVLAQLLDDPYAAVRCIAERSLRQLGEFVPQGYDYAVAPESRQAVVSEFLEKWLQKNRERGSEDFPAPTLVVPDNAPAMQENFERLSRERNSAPLRLRE